MRAKLGFTLDNPTLYITEDASLNRRVLTLSNDTGAELALRGGTPVPEDALTAAGPTSLYLTLGDLVTSAEFAAMRVTADGWKAQYFSGTFTNWALCPAKDLKLGIGGTVAFEITELRAGGQPRPGTLTVDTHNVPGVRDDATRLKVLVQNPPSGPSDLKLDHAFLTGNTIYTTRDEASLIRNRLYFSFSNPSPTTPLVPKDVPWGAKPPIFNISFVFGTAPGYGALTTPRRAADMTLDVAEQYGDAWKVVKRAEGEVPYWEAQPQAHEILGTGTASTIEFVLDDVVSDLPVGAAPDVTLMYVQYANIPGYNDGFFTLEIVKRAGPAITDFYAEPGAIPFGTDAGAAVLHWKTENVDRVSFEGAHLPSSFFEPNGKGPLADPLPVTSGEEITLVGYLSSGSVGSAAPSPEDGASSGRTKDIDDGSITVKRTLRIGGKVDVDTGLKAIGAIVTRPGWTQALLVEMNHWGSTRLATFSLADRKVHGTPLDLAAVIPAEHGADRTTRAVCASPDGHAVYAVVQARLDARATVYHTALVAVDTATHSVRLALPLGNMFNIGGVTGLLSTADGTRLVLVSVLTGESHQDVRVIDTSGFKVLDTFKWPFPLNLDSVPAPVGLDWERKRLFVRSLSGFAVMDLSNGSAASEINAVEALHLENGAIGNGMVSPDGLRIYGAAWGTKHRWESPALRPFLVQLDAESASMTLTDQASLSAEGAGVTPMAVDARGHVAYLAALDAVFAMDMDGWKVDKLMGGTSGAFGPHILVAGPEPGVLLASGKASDPNGVVSIVSLGAGPGAHADVADRDPPPTVTPP